MESPFFLDTNVFIKSLEEGEEGDEIKSFLEGKSLLTSTYVFMEYKRRLITDAISLYSFFLEEDSIESVYRRIRDIESKPNSSRQAKIWILLLCMLGYPQNEHKEKVMKLLESHIRWNLTAYFKYKTNIIESKTKCPLANVKPKMKDGNFIFDLAKKCDIQNCNLVEIIDDSKKKIVDLIKIIENEREPFFIELKKILKNHIDNSDSQLCNCDKLGDVIISLDCPEDAFLCSVDHHLRIMSEAFSTNVVEPLEN